MNAYQTINKASNEGAINSEDFDIEFQKICGKYNINIMALKSDNKMELTITSNTCFKKGDAMLVLGKYKDIQKCFHI